MRTADCDILIVPGWQDSGPEHWQSRWQSRLTTARRLEGVDFARPTQPEWVDAIVNAVGKGSAPVVVVAHSLGVIALAHAAPRLNGSRLVGAFLVAPAGERPILDTPEIDDHFFPVPRAPLPCPAVVVASRNDALCPFLDAEEWAYAWGASFVDAGDAGHINTASGYGPWPEGLMRFAGFLGKL